MTIHIEVEPLHIAIAATTVLIVIILMMLSKLDELKKLLAYEKLTNEEYRIICCLSRDIPMNKAVECSRKSPPPESDRP